MSSHTVEEMERTTKVSPVIGGAVVALALAVALAGYAAAAGLSSRSDAATKPPDATQTTALRVVSSTPYRGARGVSPAAAIVVRFSTPLSADTPYPRLTPSVPGTWRKLSSTALVFRPAGHLPPLAAVSVTVPAGRTGMRGRTGSLLARSYVFSFTTGGGSVLRLQQLSRRPWLPPTSLHDADGSASLGLRQRRPQEFGSHPPGAPTRRLYLALSGAARRTRAALESRTVHGTRTGRGHDLRVRP